MHLNNSETPKIITDYCCLYIKLYHYKIKRVRQIIIELNNNKLTYLTMLHNIGIPIELRLKSL